MKKTIIIYMLVCLSMVLSVVHVGAFETPSDKNYSPKRDTKLHDIIGTARSKENTPLKIIKLVFKKTRGYRVGGSLWDNEQWAYIVEFKSQAATKQSCSVYLKTYDSAGFLLDKHLLFAEHIMPNETKSKSDQLFVKLSYIDQIDKSDLDISCITIP